jgi:phosphoribosyl 1,2-cyclic phosphodiesterase
VFCSLSVLFLFLFLFLLFYLRSLMSLFICSLNSGSNANCYYVGTPDEAVLVDAGLSCRETIRRMQQLGLSAQNLKAIFISHEHSDHITGLAGLSGKYNLPVYITEKTREQTPVPVAPALLRSFSHNKPVPVGALTVLPFRKQHDACDPHSFMISAHGVNVGVITDIGYACRQVIKYFTRCDAVFLESNYCDAMLAGGSYPWHLKKRISSDVGHLSNAQALELFRHYRSDRLKLLVLSHLSKNNNDPELVARLFAPYAGNTECYVASRYAASPLFTVAASPVATPARTKKEVANTQLSLF